ncbi:MAG: hypothetical protein ABWY27_13980 [Telluria sp.]
MNVLRAPLLVLLIAIALPCGAAVSDRLESCDPAVVRAAAEEIFRDPHTLSEPLTLYQAAMGLAVAGQDEQAAVMYFTARLRSSRQMLFESGNRQSLLGVMEMMISPLVMPALVADPELARELVRRVVDWDRSTPDPFRDSPAAKSAEIQRKIAEIDAAMARLPDQIRDDPTRATKALEMARVAKRQINSIVSNRCGARKR